MIDEDWFDFQHIFRRDSLLFSVGLSYFLINRLEFLVIKITLVKLLLSRNSRLEKIINIKRYNSSYVWRNVKILFKSVHKLLRSSTPKLSIPYGKSIKLQIYCPTLYVCELFANDYLIIMQRERSSKSAPKVLTHT